MCHKSNHWTPQTWNPVIFLHFNPPEFWPKKGGFTPLGCLRFPVLICSSLAACALQWVMNISGFSSIRARLQHTADSSMKNSQQSAAIPSWADGDEPSPGSHRGSSSHELQHQRKQPQVVPFCRFLGENPSWKGLFSPSSGVSTPGGIEILWMWRLGTWVALLGTVGLDGFEGFSSLNDFIILSLSPCLGARLWRVLGAVQVLGFPLQGSLQGWSKISPNKAAVTG